MMADLRGAIVVPRPIAAGRVCAGREAAALHRRAGEHVVHVGRVAATIDGFAALSQCRLLVDVVAGVQLIEILRDGDAFGVLPGSLSNAIAGISADRGASPDGAQIGPPCPVAGTGGSCKVLAVLIGAD